MKFGRTCREIGSSGDACGWVDACYGLVLVCVRENLRNLSLVYDWYGVADNIRFVILRNSTVVVICCCL